MNYRSRKGSGIWFCLLLLIGGACMMGCTQQEARDDSHLQVAVTVLPQAEIAREIGGERVCVTVVVPPGVEPHTYEPSAGQLLEISESDIYFRLGPGLLPFEDNLADRISDLNPDLIIVDTSSGISLIQEDEGDKGDGEGDFHSHGTDPHIWLSPSSLRKMSAQVEEGYALIDPDHMGEYAARKEAYLQEVDATDAIIRSTLTGMEGRPFLVFHPAWGYFAREYDLNQVSVETEGKEPGIRQISTLVAFAREKGIRVVFADPQFSTRESEVIAGEINGTVVLLDPLAPDVLENLEDVAAIIARSYGKDTLGVHP